jgi:hypothetical protein
MSPGGEPSHPIVIPPGSWVHVDNSLPGPQPGIDNSLPGNQPGIDNTLPPYAQPKG